MTDNAKPIGEVLKATPVAPSPESSTKASDFWTAHKRKFLETFRRWEILFKRKDGGDAQAERWLIAEYYDSLRHLSMEGFDALTKRLKETCIFFPSIKECLDATKPAGPYDWGHPFREGGLKLSYGRGGRLLAPGEVDALPAPTLRLAADSGGTTDEP